MEQIIDLLLRVKPEVHKVIAAGCGTAYCAVWDSIAFTIMKHNGYTKEDLLLIHSGGKVGELLTEQK